MSDLKPDPNRDKSKDAPVYRGPIDCPPTPATWEFGANAREGRDQLGEGPFEVRLTLTSKKDLRAWAAFVLALEPR